MGLYTEIQAAIDTSRLAQLTNAGQPQNATTGINLTRLQQAVYYAQSRFQTRTGVVYDDVTTNAAGPPPVVNLCHPIGIALTIEQLYRWRGLPEEQQALKAASEEVDHELKIYLKSVGAGRWATPGSDSVFTPSTPVGTPPILPDMDRLNLARLAINDPAPFGSGGFNSGFTAEFGF